MTETGELERERTSADEPLDHVDIYDEDGLVRQDYLALIGEALEAEDVEYLRHNVARLHESELGDLLESLEADQRHALVRLAGDAFDFTALTEVDEAIRHIVARASAVGKPVAIYAQSAERAKGFLEMGAKLVTVMSDTAFLRGAAQSALSVLGR